MGKPRKAWMMMLKKDPQSEWGVVDDFFASIQQQDDGRDPIEFGGQAWGRCRHPGSTPAPGDAIAFYHTTKAGFRSPDPHKRKARISLLAHILEVDFRGINAWVLEAKVRRRVLKAMRDAPIVRNHDNEHLFRECKLIQGFTFFEIPPGVWEEFERLAGLQTEGRRQQR